MPKELDRSLLPGKSRQTTMMVVRVMPPHHQDVHFGTVQTWLNGGSGDGEVILDYPVDPM